MALGIKQTLCLSSSIQVNTKVTSSTLKVMDYYSYEHRIEFSADELTRKWGIGLKTYTATLRFTTQVNVRSEIFSLTNKYRTDLLSHKIRILSVKFYTDTIFDGDTSVGGN